MGGAFFGLFAELMAGTMAGLTILLSLSVMDEAATLLDSTEAVSSYAMSLLTSGCMVLLNS